MSEKLTKKDLGQEIIFVTGKGGVGRSTVAAAMAMSKAAEGKKTLLVEMGTHSFYAHYFGLDSVTYNPRPLMENLDIAKWSGKECLKEYALFLLKIESLYNLFFENPVTKTLVNVAPALTELAILGKATSYPRHVGPPLKYDCIVFDSVASGQFIALLRAPIGMSAAIKFGPMSEQSKSITEFISNPDFCKYYVVAFAEELPVIEAQELAAQIESTVHVKPTYILNKCIEFNEDLSRANGTFADYIKKEQLKQTQYFEQLSRGENTVRLPMIFSTDSWQITKSLSQVFTAGPHA